MMKESNTELLKKLLRTEMLLHRYQAYGFRALGPFGNPLRGQGRVLAILKMRPQISQKELSYLLDMRQQSLSELLMKLEARGFITRSLSEDDRRVIIITLTEEGKNAASDTAESDFDMDSVFDCLNSQEQAEFGRFFDRLTESIEKKLEAIDASLYRHGKHWGHEDRRDFDHPWGHGMHGFGPRMHGGARAPWQDDAGAGDDKGEDKKK